MVKTFLSSELEFEPQLTHPIARFVSLYLVGQESTQAKRQYRPRDNTHLSIPYTITKPKSVGSTGIRTPALRSETFSPWTSWEKRISKLGVARSYLTHYVCSPCNRLLSTPLYPGLAIPILDLHMLHRNLMHFF